MKLIRYRVMNFRSVKDSGWINCDDVTTLVGINEAGKSNYRKKYLKWTKIVMIGMLSRKLS